MTPLNTPMRIVSIIARLNIGGPAIQAISVTRCLRDYGYRATLVSGAEEPEEGNLDDLADQLGVKPVIVSWMRRDPGWRDILALVALIRILRRERPHIVHTHAAKGGGLGRVAALIACRGRRPETVLIHTFHGHSLTRYFSPRMARVYRWIERFLARYTDRLIAVSEEVRNELVAMGVAPPSKFEVVPLGLDLSRFAVKGEIRREMRKALRAELEIPQRARVVTIIARLVPIKRVDRFLRVANALRDISDLHFLIVGDGELRRQLERSAEAVALGDRLVWAGFRRDIPAVCFASDVVIQTSDNEGTPLSLIEAQAAGVPVVSTKVGGSASVVPDKRLLTAPSDIDGLASLVRGLVTEPASAVPGKRSAEIQIRDRFGLRRLIAELDHLYRHELAARNYKSRPTKRHELRNSRKVSRDKHQVSAR